MANCLVTKLKSVVNNDNLPILGKIVIKATDDSTFDSRLPNNSLLEFRGSTYEVSGDRKTIIVNNKYDVTVIYTTSITNWSLNFADFKYSPLTEITSRCNNYIGSPKDLPATITYLILRYSGKGIYKFNLSDFGHITSLTTIDTYPAIEFHIVGTIESFVSAAREAGRTTGSVTIGRKTGLSNYSDITYNGTKITTGKVVTWDASTINITDIS